MVADIYPKGIVRLCANIPWDNTYTDVRKFGSLGEQSAYIASKAVKTFNEVSYQRPNSTVTSQRPPLTCRVNAVADDLYNCNYMMFQNSNFGTKWFYAFIKQVNYINPNNTEIVYVLDHYQTWCFDYQVLPSYVLREHWSGENGETSEPLFANTQPEPVSIGEYRCAKIDTEYYTMSNAIIATTTNPEGKNTNVTYVSGILSGVQLYEIVINDTANINLFLDTYAEKGRLDAVIAIQMTPFSRSEFGASGVASDNRQYNGVSTTLLIDGYMPKNKKLYSYPFSYYTLENTDGYIQILKPQLFSGDTGVGAIQAQNISVLYEKVYGIPPIGIATPLNYSAQGIGDIKNYSYSVPLGEVPPSSWSGNAFNNWLAQNGVSMAINTISSVIGGTIGGFAEAPTGVLHGITGIANEANKLFQSTKITPQLKGGAISGNFNIAKNRVGYEFKTYTITADYAKAIDNYFDMFGYACNKLKVPNEDSRKSWNFVQCNDVVVNGSLPVEAIDTIKAMYNNGVRFWHTDEVSNYNLDNSVVINQ